MNCSPFDLRDYFLKELTEPQRRQVEAHVQSCQGCREELEQLRFTGLALSSLRDEEVPQRIAFVSDPVFPRSRWAAFWGSPARVGFAGAAMLSLAILTFSVAVTRAPHGAFSPSGFYSRAEVDQRIQQAVAAAESRQEQKTTQLVHELVDRVDSERNSRLIAEDQVKYLKDQNYQQQLALDQWVTPGAQDGGPR